MKTVLIVEDQPSVMQVLCQLFHWQGFDVIEASTGQEAIEVSTAHSPIDLILCDLSLPDKPGMKVAREVAALHPETAVLMTSGTPRESWSASDSYDFSQPPLERADFLEKPFLPSALEAKVNGLVNGRAAVGRSRTATRPSYVRSDRV